MSRSNRSRGAQDTRTQSVAGRLAPEPRNCHTAAQPAQYGAAPLLGVDERMCLRTLSAAVGVHGGLRGEVAAASLYTTSLPVHATHQSQIVLVIMWHGDRARRRWSMGHACVCSAGIRPSLQAESLTAERPRARAICCVRCVQSDGKCAFAMAHRPSAEMLAKCWEFWDSKHSFGSMMSVCKSTDPRCAGSTLLLRRGL